MPGYVRTGTPGAGKTAVRRLLEVTGQHVVEEAATDVIALAQARGNDEPWYDPDFIGQIVLLQQRWEARAPTAGAWAVFFDR